MSRRRRRLEKNEIIAIFKEATEMNAKSRDYEKIADKYNISPSLVYKIKTKRTEYYKRIIDEYLKSQIESRLLSALISVSREKLNERGFLFLIFTEIELEIEEKFFKMFSEENYKNIVEMIRTAGTSEEADVIFNTASSLIKSNFLKKICED